MEAGGARAYACARAGATAEREGREEERSVGRAEEGGGHAGGRRHNEVRSFFRRTWATTGEGDREGKWTRGGYSGRVGTSWVRKKFKIL
jgi:hypothetical protein